MVSTRLPLSTREVEVVGLVTQGRSTIEIANLLALSPDTIKTHLKNIFRKCGVHSRAELMAWWYEKEAPPAAGANAAGDGAEQGAAMVRRRELAWPRVALTAIILITAIIASSPAATFQTVVVPNGAWTPLARTHNVQSYNDPQPIDRSSVVCEPVRVERGGTDIYACPALPPVR
jgi:DNA-binding CsgD family transcriptional regulator